MRRLLPLAATAALLLLPLAARPAVAVAVSVEELARGSDVVVRGRVSRVSSFWTADGARIMTVAELSPSETWRGTTPGPVQVLVPGGVVGDIGQRVDGAPTFATGEEVVVFLWRSGEGAFRVRGLAQGKFTVVADAARPALAHTRAVGVRLAAGERLAGPMGVAELERRVRSAR
jgi:hypothetical protein